MPEIVIQGERFSTSDQGMSVQTEGLGNEDIQDLRYMINLKTLSLNVSESRITDWSPLSELTQLETLRIVQYSDLPEALAMDLSFLKHLTGLTSLEVIVRTHSSGDFAMITDLTPLAGLTSLKSLNMDGLTGVSDLSPLASLTELETLALRGAAYDPRAVSYDVIGTASDLTPLAGLTKLKSLSLLGMQTARSLEPLAGLTALQELHLCSRLESGDALAPLASLTNLQSLKLYASSYGIGSATDPLIDMPELSLEPLSSLTKLTQLHLTCKIAHGDLSALSALTSLRELTVDSNNYDAPVTDLSPLAGLQHLTDVAVTGAVERDTDQSPISHVPNMTFHSSIYYPYGS